MKRLIEYLRGHVTWDSDPRPSHHTKPYVPRYRYQLTTDVDRDDTSTIEHGSFAYSSKGKPTTLAAHSHLSRGSVIVHTSLTGSLVSASELSGCTVRNSTICCGALLLGAVVDGSRICGGRYEHCQIDESTLVKCRAVRASRVSRCTATKRSFRPGKEHQSARKRDAAKVARHLAGH